MYKREKNKQTNREALQIREKRTKEEGRRTKKRRKNIRVK